MPGPEWSIGNRANALCICTYVSLISGCRFTTTAKSWLFNVMRANWYCKAYGIQRTKVTEVSRDSPIQTKQYKTQFQIGESQSTYYMLYIYTIYSWWCSDGATKEPKPRGRHSSGVGLWAQNDHVTLWPRDPRVVFASLPQPVVWPEKAWLATTLVLFSKEHCAIWGPKYCNMGLLQNGPKMGVQWRETINHGILGIQFLRHYIGQYTVYP